MSEPHFARRPASLFSVALITLLLAGCGGGAASVDTSMVETATIEGARKSIDPAYVVAAEDRAEHKTDILSDFQRRAAEIAIREKKVYGAAAHLSSLYAENPRDKKIAFELARHLRYIGSLIEAESVLNDALAIHGPDPVLRLEQAKLYLAGGRATESLPILDTLMAEHPDDPAIMHAAGLAHDRLEQHAEAQAIYEKAMALGRPSAALLNNAGLSHLITGDLETAVALFRRGAAAPGATSQTRMNLALALSLKGDGEEAQRVANGAAPDAVTQNAVAYYSSISKPADAWSLASGG